MKFELDKKQKEKLKKWQDAIKEIYGEYGHFEYRFRPSGIGDGVRVYSDLAKTEIDLTDVESW